MGTRYKKFNLLNFCLMKLFDIFKKENAPMADEQARALYNKLMSPEYQLIYTFEDYGENMTIAKEVIRQYWKPRFLLDNNTQCAYEFMTGSEVLCKVSDDDIDWESLKGLSADCQRRAHQRDAHFPTLISRFENGVAEVSWQLNPDGMYYMDEDGYGMSDDDEVEIYGFIDRTGHVVVKFENINDNWDRLRAMRKEAEEKVKKGTAL